VFKYTLETNLALVLPKITSPHLLDWFVCWGKTILFQFCKHKTAWLADYHQARYVLVVVYPYNMLLLSLLHSIVRGGDVELQTFLSANKAVCEYYLLEKTYPLCIIEMLLCEFPVPEQIEILTIVH